MYNLYKLRMEIYRYKNEAIRSQTIISNHYISSIFSIGLMYFDYQQGMGFFLPTDLFIFRLDVYYSKCTQWPFKVGGVENMLTHRVNNNKNI